MYSESGRRREPGGGALSTSNTFDEYPRRRERLCNHEHTSRPACAFGRTPAPLLNPQKKPRGRNRLDRIPCIASASRASASSPGLWRRRTVERFRAVADANTNRYSLRFGSGGGSHPLGDRDDDGRDERGQGGAPVAPHGAPRGDEPQRRGGEPSRGFLGDAPPELGGVEERVGMAREPSHRGPVRRAERPRQHDQAEDEAE